MKTIAQLLITEENLKLRVYDDGTGKPIGPGDTLVGHPTIGVGRALDVNGISESEAMFLLQGDVLRIADQASSMFPWFEGLDEARRAVVVSMIFNIGIGGFSSFTKMIAAIAGGDFNGAASEMMGSRWAMEVPSRAQELVRIMISGTI